MYFLPKKAQIISQSKTEGVKKQKKKSCIVHKKSFLCSEQSKF